MRYTYVWLGMYVCFYYAVLVCLFFVWSRVKTDTKRRCPTRLNEEGQTPKQRDWEQKNRIQERETVRMSERGWKQREIELRDWHRVKERKTETTQIETTIYTEKGEKKREKQQTMRHRAWVRDQEQECFAEEKRSARNCSWPALFYQSVSGSIVLCFSFLTFYFLLIW